ncbi:3-hydroxybutyrate dehydrogenase [Falsibacillus albus]|uniref:3-hydroxybutyrate dehydrogenase n=1 Tax=Falsibacillus albus TaxID=2478915 RepID=A0A3L7JY07_9BACI|nr:3-hydroxybutyrate dehydrogenase [Falsibacillus albus]RLQ95410.1 3-hydroxybutyrate dehydrogenase [Falsibacillus albus]
MNMKDRTAFITGAASGIGYEIAKEFAIAGANVVISDINEQAAIKAANDLQSDGFKAIGIACNVMKEEEIINALEMAKQTYGTIDLLINNAGLQYVADIEDFPTEKFEQMIKIMLTAPFIAIKNVLPVMKEQGFGRIINMASINGLIGFAGKAAYNSAKHGVIGLTKVAALESAPNGITVNALCPGYVDTPLVQKQLQGIADTRKISVEKVFEEVIYPLVPQKRLISAKEIADYALFLCSDQAKGVTGQAVVLDGGYTAQ